jgi:hypothetical protein
MRQVFSLEAVTAVQETRWYLPIRQSSLHLNDFRGVGLNHLQFFFGELSIVHLSSR